MVFCTGDTHSDFRRFSTSNFPEQKELSRNDYVIILGDFGGVWNDSKEELYWRKWLSDKPFTVLFVDGNHENFDLLNDSCTFPIVEFLGGKAQKISDNIYHLMRGNVFTICEKRFFAFGGASSHDIKDGVLDVSDYSNMQEFLRMYNKMKEQGAMFRIKHVSWWEQELPDEYEMSLGAKSLQDNNNEVDFVITHCLPQEIASVISMGQYKPDKITTYFSRLINDGLRFNKWYCGHYHVNQNVFGKFEILYDNIVRIV